MWLDGKCFTLGPTDTNRAGRDHRQEEVKEKESEASSVFCVIVVSKALAHTQYLRQASFWMHLSICSGLDFVNFCGYKFPGIMQIQVSLTRTKIIVIIHFMTFSVVSIWKVILKGGPVKGI